jgi:hypothetical protein
MSELSYRQLVDYADVTMGQSPESICAIPKGKGCPFCKALQSLDGAILKVQFSVTHPCVPQKREPF